MKHIPFSPPDITEEEIAAVADALRSGWITTGPRTAAFEREIAAYCGADRAVCLNSATAALELALRALGIGPGDEVIEAVLSRDTVHLAAYASGLLYAATLPCRTEADLLYLLESVRRMFPNRMFRVALSGELPDGLVRSLGRRFRRVGAVRPALPGSVGPKEDSYRYASVIRMCYENR